MAATGTDVLAYIDLNGSTTDYSAVPPASVGSGTTQAYYASSTTCPFSTSPSTGPTTVTVTYSITLTNGHTYRFDSEVGVYVEAQLKALVAGTPVDFSYAQISIEPGAYSTSLTSIVGN